MPDILVYIETTGSEPVAISRELIAGARELAAGGTCTGVAVGDLKAQQLAGLDRLVLFEGEGNEALYTSDLHVAILQEAASAMPSDLILIGNSYVGLDLAAAIAAATDRPLVSYCSRLTIDNGVLNATCVTYGGKAEADIEAGLPAVVAMNAGAFKAAEQFVVPEVERRRMPASAGRISVKSQESAAVTGVNIADKERLVCVGRGVGDEDNIQLAQALADALGAELVASRPVVDLGWMEKSRQVGKSGKTVKPKLYIALGVSGAPEHLEGMRDADLIIAVNTDPSAPIFDVAHAGTTCDLLELLPALTEKIVENRA